MSILVSIVIPVYNAAPYLEACLNSVAKQSYQSIEAIVINDGSTDHSEDIIKRYTAADNRFKLVSQENHGLGYTRNRGISLSKGKYIFFLDSDDIIPAKAIQSLVSAVSISDADYAVGKVLRFNEDRKYVPIRHLEFNLYRNNETTTIIQKPELLQDSIACNKLWKRDFLIENDLLFTEGRYYEDLTLTMRGAVLAKKIEVVNEVVYLWRVREDEGKPSITQQQMKLQNTLDRLSALSANRQWMIETGTAQRIIEEHDLKSLFDVLRLHVIKYALIEEDDKGEWEERVTSFLKQIPLNVVERLPRKEKNLYNLLMTQNYTDLVLFSQMYTDTEKQQIVEQTDHQFILHGEDKSYNVTQDFKPTMIVKDLKDLGTKWELNGELTIPKAAYQVEGDFYAEARGTKDIIKISEMDYEAVEGNPHYPIEKQLFKVILDPNPLLDNKNESTFDFYFRLKEYPEYRPTRVRILSTEKGSHELNIGPAKFLLYRTNYGNFSLKVHRKELVKRVLKKVFPLPFMK